jgi:HAD superfamily hydrolase (TIGR01509 family)
LRARGVERTGREIENAFAAEVEYYRERSHEGRDEESLARLRLECVSVFLGALAADLTPEEFVETFIGAIRFELVPGALESLRSLRRRGLAVAVVSNWDIGLHEHLAGLRLGELPVVTSAEAGAPKPSAAAFLRALEQLGVRPERALHVGDSDADKRGARAAGLRFAPAPLAAVLEA